MPEPYGHNAKTFFSSLGTLLCPVYNSTSFLSLPPPPPPPVSMSPFSLTHTQAARIGMAKEKNKYIYWERERFLWHGNINDNEIEHKT
jgi:hypothetical protein